MLGISRQVYYRRKASVRQRQQKAYKVISLVSQVRQKMPRIGTRKLHYLLNEPLKELKVGRDKLFSILKANHMIIYPKRSYHITTNSHHRFYKHKNLISEIVPTRPEQIWVSDITYIGKRNNNTYLALVTDAYSKKIMGYDVSNSLSAQGSINALKMALNKRIYNDEPLIHHSDRGIQYCCDEYQDVIDKNQLICSMTETYDPYANAVAERINGILKDEFSIEEYNLSIENMKLLIKESIEIYNTIRPHYSCYMYTPNEMHKQRKISIRTYKIKKSFQASLETL